ncbi:MAG: hypothetical protein BZY88_13655 [SAR202 cluster bacterium Io17-Chloro-G9]|nr:MAG: hypothetical protein BZY88_13655 [SAR202 cluster bacterium Io17-Chloro-G9]
MSMQRSALHQTLSESGAKFHQQQGWDLPQCFASASEEYQTAVTGAAVHDMSYAGRLRATGADTLDLINRLSTNKVDELQPGHGAPTILTTDQGRIFDLIYVVNTGDHVLLITSPETQQPIIDWLDKYTIMDDIEVEDVTETTTMLVLLGPGADDALAQAAGQDSGLAQQLPAYGYAAIEIGGVTAQVIRQSLGDVPAFTLVLAPQDAPAAWRGLMDSGVSPIGTEAYDAVRVAHGVPTYGHEMGQAFNPLEAGLIGSIDFAKGCYIGQEVIARLDTYQKVQKHLVTLKFGPEAQVDLGTSLVQEGKVVGMVTSLSAISGGDQLVGLGYVRKANASQGSRLDLEAPAQGWAEISGFSQIFGPGE